MQPTQTQFPKMDEGMVSIQVERPEGSNLDYTDEMTFKVEEICAEVPESQTVSSTIRGNNGSIFVTLGNVEDRDRSLWEVIDDLREKVKGFRNVDIRVREGSHRGGEEDFPVQVQIVGDDYKAIQNYAERVKERMKSVPEVWDVETSFDRGTPEIQIFIDRKRAADLGLSTRQIAETIETYMAGTVAGQFRVEGNEYDIRVRLTERQRDLVKDLEGIQIANRQGLLIPLSEVTTLYPTTGPVSLDRDEQRRLVSVNAQGDRNRIQDANQAVMNAISDMPPPSGCFIQMGGEFKAMQEAFQQLGLALMFAIVLVFLIMAAQFESFTQPFIIMTTVPLSLAGVYLVLFVTGVSMSIPAYVGIIMLAGIVVNNSILLVDYINILRSRGYALRDAAVKASKIRLRPVLMTTLTTVLGMMPLALGWGSGSEFYKPLALAVIGGLSLSTFFTLVLTPVLYILLTQFIEGVKRVVSSR